MTEPMYRSIFADNAAPAPHPTDQFALIRTSHIPGPSRADVLARADMVGPLSALTEPVLSSRAREATEQLLNDTAEAIEEQEAQAREMAERQDAYTRRVLQDLCDGIAVMSHRFDAFLSRERERQRAARSKARADLEASLPDPDNPDAPPTDTPPGDYPAPDLQPSLRLQDPEDEGAYAHYPDGPHVQSPGKPAELPQDRPDADEFETDPNLPEGMGSSGDPSSGTMPQLPEDLAHPQPSKQTPTSVGGP